MELLGIGLGEWTWGFGLALLIIVLNRDFHKNDHKYERHAERNEETSPDDVGGAQRESDHAATRGRAGEELGR